MNIHIENVDFNSSSGPNSFANKLVKYMQMNDVTFDVNEKPDCHLCFIESHRTNYNNPMFQRLDGIYFNTAMDYMLQNRNIKRTYDMADGVIFQSNFNKELIFKYFGSHENYVVIHNGADLQLIEEIPPIKLDRYEKLWACASSWRPHKRLKENIEYFLSHSGEKDGLMIAGDVPFSDRIKHERIHYLGNLKQRQLFSLYKKTDFFIHLAWLDHCPNVVVDARSCGSKIICSSSGGTKEIAGEDAIIIEEPVWDFQPVKLYHPPKLNFDKKVDNVRNVCYNCDMIEKSQLYKDFMGEYCEDDKKIT